MDKRFDPKTYEGRWQQQWQEMDLFRAEAPSDRPPFCLMIPPPNVTGKLHMGHALQTALQDLLVRWKRMKGYNALWVPGTDHAGIATQLMVERSLAVEGKDRHSLGREAFLERMWTWKAEYHDNIQSQLDLLGASCDWSRERFTLDETLSRAVQEAFVRLFDKGLIYRGEYMVNWSPVLGTAVSDLEVEMKPVEGRLYHVAYPVEGREERIVVATTRPETLLGDTGVAFHPEDERYEHLRNQFAVLPLVGRRIPFVVDEHVEKDFGTGLVKVTPFHDQADFEMGQRHDLERIQVIGFNGRMTAAAGPDFEGLERDEARRKILEMLDAQGLLVKVEKHQHNVGHSQRSGEAIEPLVSTQWFCNVDEMARRALEGVRDGSLKLVPDTYEKTWEHWLENIRPWCISRQLWWGHRVPAWYNEDGDCFVARSFEEAAEKAGTINLHQDEDVLDTWFSSGLWPFSTLGWPEETPDLATFYPTDILVTGYDILFFWVARMAMMGLEFTDQMPFRQVHLTGLVRDADGVKMSKTKGNVVDPAELIEEYGADAVRFTLCLLDTPGNDIPLDPQRMAGYRAFGNKIWNATRFSLSRVGEARIAADWSPEQLAELAAPERWILTRLSKTADEVNEKLTIFRFDEACNRLYHFFWGELCDWYIELAKPALSGDGERPLVGEVLLTVLDRALRLLHPVMPFLTEELWQKLPGHEAIEERSIALAPFPERVEAWEDSKAEAHMETLIEVVSRCRAMLADAGHPKSADVALHLESDDSSLADFLRQQASLIGTLVRVASVDFENPPEGSTSDLVAGVQLSLEVARASLGDEERARIAKEIDELDEQIRRAESRLSNEAFLSKAPEAVVKGNREKLTELKERRERLAASLQ